MNDSNTIKIYDNKKIRKVEKKIDFLSTSFKLNAIEFLNVRLITSIIVFLISVYVFDYGYIIGPIVTIIYYNLFERLLLDSKIKQRKDNLEIEAIHFFEVLTLSLETGRNLEEAIRVTTSSMDGILSEEFKEVLRETKFGKSLKESLLDLQRKIPSESINNIILALAESNIYGSSIINTMYNQVDYLREKRKLEVKAEISKIPVKISVISVFFFIPLILLIVLGPIIVTYFG